jgi:hypothetical protein
MCVIPFIDDTPPRCRKPVKLTVIEPHPSAIRASNANWSLN